MLQFSFKIAFNVYMIINYKNAIKLSHNLKIKL